MLMALIIAAAAMGDGPQRTETDMAVVENSFRVSSMWELVWFEEDGKREGDMDVFKYAKRGKAAQKYFP